MPDLTILTPTGKHFVMDLTGRALLVIFGITQGVTMAMPGIQWWGIVISVLSVILGNILLNKVANNYARSNDSNSN